MARTLPFARLRRALRLAIGAEKSGIAPREYVELANDRLSRRRLLQGSAAAAATIPLAACGDDSPPMTEGARVAIVGAGIAGLTCAYRLQQAGVATKLFDSWNRTGGRMFTARGMWADEQVVELGGELIDTDHDALRSLATEFGLTLDPILETPGSGIAQDTWFFGGRALTDAEIVTAFTPIAAQMAIAVASEKDEAEFTRIDELGLGAYLDSLSDLDPTLRSLLDVAYVGEYGLEIDQQSPWNLLWLIDSETPDPFRIYGDSDEAFHVHGGNDQIPTLLAEALEAPIALEHRLVRVAENGMGQFTLTFDRGTATSVEETFDRVVFALPFTRLRSVEIVPELPAEKKEIVDTLGMGTNAKLMGQFDARVWRTMHMASGSVTTDNGLQLLWETSRGQMGNSGILTVFAGGSVGAMIGAGEAEMQMMSRLGSIDEIFPGAMASYRAASAVRMHWPTVEHTLGSYTCFLPGQARFSGLEGERVGNLHFCGEHTSVDYQGYMNGGAESGERVAAEILADLGM
jgi:monoamine oxidase